MANKAPFPKPKADSESSEEIKKPSLKSETKNDTKKVSKIVLQATRNTQLPDGKFVGEGTEVVVASSYAEKVLKEKNTPFKLISK